MNAFSELLLVPYVALAQVSNPPTKLGFLLFPGFQALDILGPLDILNVMGGSVNGTSVSLLSRTLNPESTISPTSNSTVGHSVVVTHTLDAPPSGLEVLVVPGVGGTRSPDLQPEIDFIRNSSPSLRYVIGICTGNALLARAGILDGKKAAGNKKSWNWLTAQSKKVRWIGKLAGWSALQPSQDLEHH